MKINRIFKLLEIEEEDARTISLLREAAFRECFGLLVFLSAYNQVKSKHNFSLE